MQSSLDDLDQCNQILLNEFKDLRVFSCQMEVQIECMNDIQVLRRISFKNNRIKKLINHLVKIVDKIPEAFPDTPNQRWNQK